jgi:hypothetical protein
MSLFQHLYLAYFSQPAAERVLYRAIRRQKVRRLVEIGIGNGVRSRRLILAAQGVKATAPVRYSGIDLFETRQHHDPPGLPLKEAYRLLKSTGAQTQLVPGDPFSALARVANALSGTDLVIISSDQDQKAVSRAWFYLPRLLCPTSQVFCEEMDTATNRMRFRLLSPVEIQELTAKGERRRAA